MVSRAHHHLSTGISRMHREYIRFHRFPVSGVDAMTASTARSFPRHTHDEYGIGIVDAGGHSSWSGRGQVEAGPGSLICVNAGEVHDGRAVDRRPRAWRILYFDPALLDEARADILEGAATPFFFATPVFSDDTLRTRFETAFAFVAPSGDVRETLAVEAALLALVARLGRHSTAGPERSIRSTGSVRRARSRIDADPAARLTLADLAAEAGLSRYQLLRGFARELGLTPHVYVLQRRLALARRLLRMGRGLAETALHAGFCDQSHLSRCFVRQFGVTPRRFALRSA